jgi:hypothetical protein
MKHHGKDNGRRRPGTLRGFRSRRPLGASLRRQPAVNRRPEPPSGFGSGLRLESAEVPEPPAVLVRPLTAGDRSWVRATLVRNWSSTTVARRGELIEARDLAGYAVRHLEEARLVGIHADRPYAVSLSA